MNLCFKTYVLLFRNEFVSLNVPVSSVQSINLLKIMENIKAMDSASLDTLFPSKCQLLPSFPPIFNPHSSYPGLKSLHFTPCLSLKWLWLAHCQLVDWQMPAIMFVKKSVVPFTHLWMPLLYKSSMSRWGALATHLNISFFMSTVAFIVFGFIKSIFLEC